MKFEEGTTLASGSGFYAAASVGNGMPTRIQNVYDDEHSLVRCELAAEHFLQVPTAPFGKIVDVARDDGAHVVEITPSRPAFK